MDQGQVIDPEEWAKREPSGDDPIKYKEWRWPLFMIEIGKATSVGENKKAVPRLMSWTPNTSTDDPATANETYVVDFRGAHNTGKTRMEVAQAIAGAISTKLPKVEQVTATAVKFTYSHYSLPKKIAFPGLDPGQKDYFKVGISMTGDELVWNPLDRPHGAAVGETGSGKTILAKLIIAQALMMGWNVTFITAKKNDPTVDIFRDHPNFEDICGSDLPTITKMTERLNHILETDAADKLDQVSDAKKFSREQGEFLDIEDFGEPVEGWVWEGSRRLVIIDEVPSLMAGKHKPSHPISGFQEAVTNRVTQGRQAGEHVLFASQDLYVSAFGPDGGRIRNNLSFLCGLRQVNERSAEIVSPNERAAEMLVEGFPNPGRGIVTGADGEGSSTVLQGYYVADREIHKMATADQIEQEIEEGDIDPDVFDEAVDSMFDDIVDNYGPAPTPGAAKVEMVWERRNTFTIGKDPETITIGKLIPGTTTTYLAPAKEQSAISSDATGFKVLALMYLAVGVAVIAAIMSVAVM